LWDADLDKDFTKVLVRLSVLEHQSKSSSSWLMVPFATRTCPSVSSEPGLDMLIC
jgi:hypothetical protein